MPGVWNEKNANGQNKKKTWVVRVILNVGGRCKIENQVVLKFCIEFNKSPVEELRLYAPTP
jgi:hypothetical protein